MQGVAAGLTFLLCAVPPATNVSPGPWGYGLVLVVLTVLALWLRARPVVAAPLTKLEVTAGVALFGWITLGVLRAEQFWDVALVAALLAASAAVAAHGLASRLTRHQLTDTVVLMAGAAIAGSVLSGWITPLLGGDWGLRPGLPLGGASNNAVGLVLAVAGCLGGSRRWPGQRDVWLVLAAAGGLLIAQSVSRAGWLLLVLLLLAVAQQRLGWSWRRILTIGTPVTLAAVTLLALLRGRGALIDAARWDNAAVGLDAWWTSPASVLFGVGPMSLWPWLPLERYWASRGSTGTTLYDSPWGPVLYHAHSTFVSALVEYGLVGLVLLLLVLGLAARRCVREIRAKGELSLVAVAVLLALPAMLVELYLFRSFVSAWLWWVAVTAVGRGPHDEAEREGGDEGPNSGEQRDGARYPQARGEDLDAEPEHGHSDRGARQDQDLAH